MTGSHPGRRSASLCPAARLHATPAMTPLTDTPLPPTALAVYVARHPIFDANDRRVAYELLYRDGPLSTVAGNQPADLMCSEMALHAMLTIGLDRLTGGATAWINMTREHLLAGLHRVFDPRDIVVELLETIEGDPAVLDACAQARADGYLLALDDYDGRPELEPLLQYASIVKIVVLHMTESTLTPLVAHLRDRGIVVLAECVETEAQRAMCQRVGCALFQGYVFSRPETFAGRAMSVEQVAIMNLLAMLNDERITDTKLQDAFQSSPTLAHALLRIVNSAAIGMRAVESIPHAMRIVGRSAMAQWLQVMLAATVASRSPLAHEAVAQALVRARFCELVAIARGGGDPAAQFMVGLLSRLDVLLGIPMRDVIARLPVTSAVSEALLHGTGQYAGVLNLVVAYERGEWDRVSAQSELEQDKVHELMDAYAGATVWATQRLQTVTVLQPR
jgi:EAL and modified HD-GYP domain-containing signal transduction protein